MLASALSKAKEVYKSVFKLLLPIFLASVLFVPARAAEPGSPEAAVEQLNSAILQALHTPSASNFDTRVGMLRPLMVSAFDYPFMARIAAGRYWKDFTAEQEQRYVALFTDLSVATAASRFKAQPRAGLTVTGEREGPRNTKLIETTLTLPGKTPRVISYLMRQDDFGAWRAIDIFFESRVSELSTKRSEYTSILGKDGIASFLNALQKKYNEYKEEG